MLDIGGIQADPIDEHLDMTAIDTETLNLISKFTKNNNLGADLAEKDNNVSEAFNKGVEDDDDSQSDDADMAHAMNIAAHQKADEINRQRTKASGIKTGKISTM